MYSWDLWLTSLLDVSLPLWKSNINRNNNHIRVNIIKIFKNEFRHISIWLRLSSLRFIIRDHKQQGISENQSPAKYKT